MPTYGPKAQEKVHKTLSEFKAGELSMGKSGKPVTSRKQAIAIGLAQARREGVKVPPMTNERRMKATARSMGRR
jgi:hypothetical protein